jgi:hypothetical protein
MAQALESRTQLLESVYSAIRQNSGKIQSTDLDRIIGNKQDVRFAITRLTIMGKISRKRDLGKSGIEYFYHATEAPSFEKHRRMEMRIFAENRRY